MRLVNIKDFPDGFQVLLELMASSAFHKRWSVADVVRLIVPAIELHQILLFVQGGAVVGMVTWSFFSEEVAEDFRNGVRLIQKSDWNSGSELWIIDFIYLGDSMFSAIRGLKRVLAMKYPLQAGALGIRRSSQSHCRRLSKWASPRL